LKYFFAHDEACTGVAKSIVCIAGVVPQPVRTSGIFKNLLYKYHTDKPIALDKKRQVSQNKILLALSMQL
jgi:hypothetical protein